MKSLPFLLAVAIVVLLFAVASSAARADSLYLDPDCDISIQWCVYPGTDHFEAVDDAIRQPKIPDKEDYLYCYRYFSPSRSDGVGEDIYALTNIAEDIKDPAISKIKVWAYWLRPSSGGGVKCDIKIDDKWTKETYFSDIGSGGAAWSSVTFSAPKDGWTKKEVNDLQIKVINQLPPIGNIYIFALYVEVICD